ncbi:MAG TPA: HNH endonuclease family protein [Candidatus Saccharimonadales bacterium]|nr:HNH endonuclease family protein [Candidatus Saccharimonadales bacterium]
MLKTRVIKLVIGLLLITATVLIHVWQNHAATPDLSRLNGSAAMALKSLPVKGRAPKTGYNRDQFGNGWSENKGCDTREWILQRDLTEVELEPNGCDVKSGQLLDPYTGQVIAFQRGPMTSGDVQIDHVVALSNAWQTGAQALGFNQRQAFANDPLELLAVDGGANQQKSDGDAATWLPKNKTFRCSYVARQIAIKLKYQLWVTAAERDAMTRILNTCPDQPLPAGFSL